MEEPQGPDDNEIIPSDAEAQVFCRDPKSSRYPQRNLGICKRAISRLKIRQRNCLRKWNSKAVGTWGSYFIANKGFLIQDLLPCGVTLNIPTFLTNGVFTCQESIYTLKIAWACIHVERAIGRIKAFSILDFIPHHMRKYSSVIFQGSPEGESRRQRLRLSYRKERVPSIYLTSYMICTPEGRL